MNTHMHTLSSLTVTHILSHTQCLLLINARCCQSCLQRCHIQNFFSLNMFFSEANQKLQCLAAKSCSRSQAATATLFQVQPVKYLCQQLLVTVWKQFLVIFCEHFTVVVCKQFLVTVWKQFLVILCKHFPANKDKKIKLKKSGLQL